MASAVLATHPSVRGCSAVPGKGIVSAPLTGGVDATSRDIPSFVAVIRYETPSSQLIALLALTLIDPAGRLAIGAGAWIV